MLTIQLPEILVFFIYEVALFFSGLRLIYLISSRTRQDFGNLEFFILSLSSSIVLSVIVSTVFSFSSFNGIVQYVLASTSLLLLLHIVKKSNLRDYSTYLSETFQKMTKKVLDWRILLMVTLLIPLVFGIMRPYSDPDSLQLMNHLLGWAFNQNVPYENWANYIPFWQLSYLPSIVITHSDDFLWYNSLKPVFILALGTYLIGRKIGLSKNLAWISVFASCFFFVFWNSWGDLGTIKDDYILGAGVVMLALGIMRSLQRRFDYFTGVFLMIGTILSSVKFFGVFIIIVSLILFLLFNWKKISLNKKKVFAWGIFSFLVIFIVTGNYYLHNYLKFGNPFYPFKINILGLGFDGPFNGSGTSILSHITENHLWQILIPTNQVSLGGIFFPVTLAFGSIAVIGLISFYITRLIKIKKTDLCLLFLSVFVFVTWCLYLNSFLSAGATPSDLSFNLLNNTRYVIGTIFITEIFFVFLLSRLRIPEIIIVCIIGISLASRVWIDYYRLPDYLNYSLLIYPIAAIAVYFVFSRYYNKLLIKASIMGFLWFSILIFSPQIVEENRVAWVPWWHNVVSTVYALPSSQIYLMSGEDDAGKSWPLKYVVYGDHFQHSLRVGTEKVLLESLSNGRVNSSFYPKYVIELCWRQFDCTEETQKMNTDLISYGYKITTQDSHAIMFGLYK